MQKKCNSILARDEKVEEHLLKIHSFGCHICDKTFNSEQNLELHPYFDHKETGAEASCQICKFSFPTQEEYENHLPGLQHNVVQKTENYGVSYSEDDSIDSCGIVLHSYEEVDDHVIICHNRFLSLLNKPLSRMVNPNQGGAKWPAGENWLYWS